VAKFIVKNLGAQKRKERYKMRKKVGGKKVL